MSNALACIRMHQKIELMDFTWHGHSCFTIKGKDATVLIDPFEGLGPKLPKLKADIIILSGQGETSEIEGNPKLIDWPGEFEISNVAIETFNPNEDAHTICIFSLDGIKICHLSYLSHELSDEIIEHIGDIDVLLIPVGGSEVLDGKTAQKVVEEIEPRLVIPMLYAATETKLKIKGAEDFLKAMGRADKESQEKFSVNGRSALPEDNMELVLLSPKL